MKTSDIGIPWYRREDYGEVLVVMEDAAHFPRSFETWLRRAKQTLKNLRRAGAVAYEVYIDPKTFPGWCQQRGLNVDARARAEFAKTAGNATTRDEH